MKFAIVSKKDDKSRRVEIYVKQQLESHQWTYDKIYPELVICIGGDGTLLYGVHKYINIMNEIKFLGIHTGTLGFFTDYTGDDVDACIHDLLTKKPEVYESRLLKFQLDNDPKVRYALNEIRIENIIKSQIMNLYIDDEFFETCRGSGICLSTQAGSTAYNRSLRGAVIDSGLSLMQLTEITPIQHSVHRSLGVPYIMMENRVIKIKSDNFDTAFLCYDHLSIPLTETKQIICEMSNLKVKFARYREYSYLDRLKNLY